MYDNFSNNNNRVYDLANREDDFWAQPQEEPFYTPHPPSTLAPSLPFVNYSDDGLHDLPVDAHWLFGDSDSDLESLNPIEIDIAEDVDIYADLPSPTRASGSDSDVILDSDQSVDLPPSAGTSSLYLDAIFEEAENIVSNREHSNEFSLNDLSTADETESEDPLVRDTLNLIREYEIIRAETEAVLHQFDSMDEPRNPTADTTRWDRLPTFSSSSSLLSPSTLPSGTFISGNTESRQDDDNAICHIILRPAGTDSSSATRETDDTDLIDRWVIQEKFVPRWEEITEDANLGLESGRSSSSNVDAPSVDLLALLKRALMERNTMADHNENSRQCLSLPESHNEYEDPADEWPTSSRISQGYNILNIPSHELMNGTELVGRWLTENHSQREAAFTYQRHSGYYGNISRDVSLAEPRLSHSAIELRSNNSRKRKLNQEDEVVKSKSDTALTSRTILSAKRRRF